jgi:hypothetical protein
MSIGCLKSLFIVDVSAIRKESRPEVMTGVTFFLVIGTIEQSDDLA